MENEQINAGLYVPNNFIWDVNNLNNVEVNSLEFKELLVRLYQNINLMCIALNLKDSAYYVEQEFLNGQLFFANPQDQENNQRQAFRITINFGTLPNATAISIPHGITAIDGNYSFTRIYGAASDPVNMDYIPLPYASSNGTDNIQLDIDATNVTLTTTANYSLYTISYVILEYLKN